MAARFEREVVAGVAVSASKYASVRPERLEQQEPPGQQVLVSRHTVAPPPPSSPTTEVPYTDSNISRTCLPLSLVETKDRDSSLQASKSAT